MGLRCNLRDNPRVFPSRCAHVSCVTHVKHPRQTRVKHASTPFVKDMSRICETQNQYQMCVCVCVCVCVFWDACFSCPLLCRFGVQL